MTRLVIVESPTKAKTIQKFLPKEYEVKACMGHIRDLPADAEEIPESVKGQPWARLGVNIEANFAPLYVIPESKKKTVRELKDALRGAEELIVATDEDREGESIGWHLVQVLNPKVPVRRMVFHEITRSAIQDALTHYRDIDDKLVHAQETRRILDRLVGYTVSPLLWKKVAPGLSAGRVQSVAVKLLVNREDQRRMFHQATFWDLIVDLAKQNAAQPEREKFQAVLQSVDGVRIATGKDFDEATGKVTAGKKVRVLSDAEADALRDQLRAATYRVIDLTEKEQVRRPAPPFTTSTLQQEANRKLRLPARETMKIAQHLYEQGFITYMRTDSVHLSAEAIGAARHAISERYGDEYLSPKPRQFTTQSKGAQEAHEAIRPAGTQMLTAEDLRLSGVEAAVYEMIWKRTMASQMADARLTLLTALIQAANAIFQANGRRIDFPGFFRVYVEGSDDPDAALDDRAVLLPTLTIGEDLRLLSIEPAKHETQPPARFTEASLVQMLEKEGVGRPSTYATIIGTIQDRGYAVKSASQLVPTFTAMAVNRLLEGNFPSLVDTKFTAHMEETLDEIAEGEADWLPYLHDFYLGDRGLEVQVREKTESIDPREIYAMAIDDLKARVRVGRFGPYLEQQMEGSAIRATLPVDLAPADLTEGDARRLLYEKEKGPNALGTDPKTGLPVLLLTGRFGPYIQLGTTSDAGDGKPKRASLLKEMSPESLTLDLALALLSLPRPLGQDADTGELIEAGVGPLGPFIRRGKDYRSLTADDDVLTVGLDRALELLQQPRQRRGARSGPQQIRDLGAHPDDGQPITVMNGRYGPYVKHGDLNATIPRETNPESITLQQAVDLLAARAAAAPAKPKRRTAATGRTRTAAKTTGKASAKSAASAPSGEKAAPKKAAVKRATTTPKATAKPAATAKPPTRKTASTTKPTKATKTTTQRTAKAVDREQPPIDVSGTPVESVVKSAKPATPRKASRAKSARTNDSSQPALIPDRAVDTASDRT